MHVCVFVTLQIYPNLHTEMQRAKTRQEILKTKLRRLAVLDRKTHCKASIVKTVGKQI